MKIRKIYEAYDKKEFLDKQFNYQKIEHIIYEYPGGAGHELLSSFRCKKI